MLKKGSIDFSPRKKQGLRRVVERLFLSKARPEKWGFVISDPRISGSITPFDDFWSNRREGNTVIFFAEPKTSQKIGACGRL